MLNYHRFLQSAHHLRATKMGGQLHLLWVESTSSLRGYRWDTERIHFSSVELFFLHHFHLSLSYLSLLHFHIYLPSVL